jgi:uncharacterized protein YqeY
VTLREQIEADAREALRAREAGQLRLAVLRLLRAAVQREEIERRRPLGDDEVREVVAREVRQRQDALAELAGRGRPEAEAQLRAEIEILRGYLPPALGQEELEALARQAIAEAGASGPAQTGRVMALLMPRVRGRADGAAGAATVRRLLGG